MLNKQKRVVNVFYKKKKSDHGKNRATNSKPLFY